MIDALRMQISLWVSSSWVGGSAAKNTGHSGDYQKAFEVSVLASARPDRPPEATM